MSPEAKSGLVAGVLLALCCGGPLLVTLLAVSGVTLGALVAGPVGLALGLGAGGAALWGILALRKRSQPTGDGTRGSTPVGAHQVRALPPEREDG